VKIDAVGHTLLTDVNKFLSIIYTFLGRFLRNLVQQLYTANRSAKISFVKIGTVKPTAYLEACPLFCP